MKEWIVTLFGPKDSPYYGGNFTLEVTFPPNYPFEALKIKFLTPIYHPNISSYGDICIDILKDKWTAALTLAKTILSLSSLLVEPNPHDPLRGEAADLYLNDKDEYYRVAREQTLKYAVASHKK